MSRKNSGIVDRIEQVPYGTETEVYTEWLEGLFVGDHLMINGDQYEVQAVSTKHGGFLSVTSPDLQQDEFKPDSRAVGPSADGDILILVDHNYPINDTWIEITDIKQVVPNTQLCMECEEIES
jgi:hypothetical protein